MATEWNEQTAERLAVLALRARETAYCPYSGFAVGAALLAKSGEIYTGVNIENAAFTPTNCAERTAFFTAIAKGERDFVAVAIAGGKAGEEPEDFCAPCGVCRQVMREFCGDDL
jgi:cytidine deaminase